MKTYFHFFLLLFIALITPTFLVAENAEFFIFSSDKVVNSAKESEFVKIQERLPIAVLKKRFSRYKIKVIVGEDCNVCAEISNGKNSFVVDFDSDGIVVTAIHSNDKFSTDMMGHVIGDPLTEAVSREANCINELVVACEARNSDTLWYEVSENTKLCELVVADKGRKTMVPSCSKIDGFHIFSAESTAGREKESNCEDKYFVANAVFIRSATVCDRNFMDTKAAYFALEKSKACISGLTQAQITSRARDAMIKFDTVVKQRGKKFACQMVADFERSIAKEIP